MHILVPFGLETPFKKVKIVGMFWIFISFQNLNFTLFISKWSFQKIVDYVLFKDMDWIFTFKT